MGNLLGVLSPEEKLIHDVRNCLFAIDAAATSLPSLRADDERFAQTQQMITRQIQELKEILKRREADLYKQP